MTSPSDHLCGLWIATSTTRPRDRALSRRTDSNDESDFPALELLQRLQRLELLLCQFWHGPRSAKDHGRSPGGSATPAQAMGAAGALGLSTRPRIRASRSATA